MSIPETCPANSTHPDGSELPTIIDGTDSIFRTLGCVGCGICIDVCRETQGMDNVLFQRGRGENSKIVFHADNCIGCGQCSKNCPLEVIREVSQEAEVNEILANKQLHSVVQIAPAIKAAFVKKYDIKPEVVNGKQLSAGEVANGKLYTAMHLLGFDTVTDTALAADLTIMEEGSELLRRIVGNETARLPLITSCCPGWVNLAETQLPEFLPNFSTCKSPQQMLGALAKTVLVNNSRAENPNSPENALDPKDIKMVSVMPCTAKKSEAKRPQLIDAALWNGESPEAAYPDVDNVLTTRELMRMIDKAGIDFASLPLGQADPLLGEFTGAGNIFGATGGVMEAAVRSAYFLATGETLEDIDLKPLRGIEGVKTASVMFGETKVNVAIAHGGANVRKLLDMIKSGEIEDLHFVEIMMCPGGCVGGGGQPVDMTGLPNASEMGQTLYDHDKNLPPPKRQSHLNEGVQKLYTSFLGEPGGKISHHLLHTEYNDRSTEHTDKPTQPNHVN